jgi:hypothetical protein
VFEEDFQSHNGHHMILIFGVCILLRVWDQGEGQGERVFRLRNFNIVGFSTFILLRYMFGF